MNQRAHRALRNRGSLLRWVLYGLYGLYNRVSLAIRHSV